MKILTLGDAARATGIAPETLRSYCRAGLLDPPRDSAGRRLFYEVDLPRIREIYLDNMARRSSPRRGG